MDKLVDKCNNSYYCSTGNKPIHADYSALPEEFESSHKALRFKVGDRARIAKHKSILPKVTLKKGRKKYL